MMKIGEVVKKFLNFNMVGFEFIFRIWKDTGGTMRQEFSVGKIPEKYTEYECKKVEINANEGIITFYCSENDEDF